VIVVSDTGPLIALAKVDQLILLERLFGKVLIPPAVERELLAKHGTESARLDDALLNSLDVVPLSVPSPEVEIATLRLDLGEQQAVALAYEQGGLLVIDDSLGRTAARRLNLAVTGAVGVVIRARKEGLVPSVRSLLEEMRQHNYWLSDELLDIATRLAGEA
jgi:predicted nucleic acid-binding protein